MHPMFKLGTSLLLAISLQMGCGQLSHALAQSDTGQTAIDVLSKNAAAGNIEAQRKLGEKLIVGDGVKQDVVRGRQLLEAAAANGDVKAMASLGKFLLDGYYLPADPQRAVPLLKRAAASGSTSARLSLGSAYLHGFRVKADPDMAESFLAQAAADGDHDAQRILGQQLVGGWVLKRDQAKGLKLLEAAVAAGDSKAQVVLGTLLLDGTGVRVDEKRALQLFEAAAAKRNGQGLERYGAKLMWRGGAQKAAEEYLRRAGELGRGAAWTTLAEGAMYGRLGKGSRAKFTEFAKKATAAGETHIAILEANRRIWGISMRASGPEAVKGLEAAVKSGNKEALLFLIGLVRNGNHYNVRRDTAQARAYITRYGAMLTPLERRQQTFLVDVAGVRTVAAYRRFATALARAPEMNSAGFGRGLYSANQNFAVYLVQDRMRKAKVYDGGLNGLLTERTIRSLLQYCRARGDSQKCNRGKIDGELIETLMKS